MRGYPLWLICGTPCSGQTTFGNWLRDQKAFLHLDLEARDFLASNGLPQFRPERIWDLDAAGLAEFVAYLRTLDRGVVLTGAFQPDPIPVVHQLVQSGIEGWRFEAHRLGARQKFLARHTTIRDGVYVPAARLPPTRQGPIAASRRWSRIGQKFLRSSSRESFVLSR